MKVSDAPYPGTGLFALQSSASGITELKIEVSDIRGKIVYSDKRSLQDGTRSMLDLTTLAPGVYTLSADTGKQVKHVKLVIQK